MMAPFRRPISCLSTAAALVIAAGSCVPTAHAQIGESTGLVNALSPEYLNRDIVIFVDGLGLDETQRVIVEALFDDYLVGFDDAREQMNLAYEGMQDRLKDNPDKASVVRAALEPLKQLIGTKRELEEELFRGVQVVLTDEQQAMWPSFLRRLTREKTLIKGQLEGESLDLYHVIRDMRLPESVLRGIESVLMEYEIALDNALQARNALFQQSQLDLLNSISEQGQVMDTSASERQVHLRVAVRDVNDTYREEIAEALGPELGPTFRQIALERAYPTIYRRTMLQKVLASALELPDLSAASREIVESLQESYLTELAELNAALLADRRVAEPQELLDRIAAFKARLSGERQQTPRQQRTNLYRRDDLAEPYLKSLRAALTEEQFAALPQAARMLERQQRLERMRRMEEAAREGKENELGSGNTPDRNAVPDRNKLQSDGNRGGGR